MKNLFLLLLLQTVSFSIPKTTETILVLAQSDKRFYSAVSSSSTWQFDFKLFKRRETDALASSAYSGAMRRSRKLAIDLEPGDYIVHVRLTGSLLVVCACVPIKLISRCCTICLVCQYQINFELVVSPVH